MQTLLLRVLVFQRTGDIYWVRRMIKPREFGIFPLARLFNHLLAIRFDFIESIFSSLLFFLSGACYYSTISNTKHRRDRLTRSYSSALGFDENLVHENPLAWIKGRAACFI